MMSGMSELPHTMDVEDVIARRREPAYDCTMAKALDVVSTRSAMLLLREAFYGTSRFDDFTVRVGISEPVAAARLKELVAHGLLVREPYREAGQRTRYAYRLTDKGADLAPALVALLRWGERWETEAGGPVQLTHTGCGEPVDAEIRCRAGHRVSPEEIHVARSAEAGRLRALREAARAASDSDSGAA